MRIRSVAPILGGCEPKCRAVRKIIPDLGMLVNRHTSIHLCGL
jgi:hypothetical protein